MGDTDKTMTREILVEDFPPKIPKYEDQVLSPKYQDENSVLKEDQIDVRFPAPQGVGCEAPTL